MEQTEKTASKIIPVSFQGYKNEIYFEIVSQKQQRKRIIRGGSFVVTKMFININFKVYLVYKREYIFDSKKYVIRRNTSFKVGLFPTMTSN